MTPRRQGQSERDIRDACPGALVLPGLAIRGGSVTGAESDVRRWIESTGLKS